MTTLRDVAALAGVSAMTVSNVVNGREHKVSPATRERVRGAIETLGYVPNAQVRTLAGSSSRIIALVYGAGDGLPALTASHESAFVGACECAARRAGDGPPPGGTRSRAPRGPEAGLPRSLGHYPGGPQAERRPGSLWDPGLTPWLRPASIR